MRWREPNTDEGRREGVNATHRHVALLTQYPMNRTQLYPCHVSPTNFPQPNAGPQARVYDRIVHIPVPFPWIGLGRMGCEDLPQQADKELSRTVCVLTIYWPIPERSVVFFCGARLLLRLVSVLILTSVEIDEKLSWVEVGSGGCLPPSRSFVKAHLWPILLPTVTSVLIHTMNSSRPQPNSDGKRCLREKKKKRRRRTRSKLGEWVIGFN